MGIGKLLVRGLGAGMQGYGKYLQTVDERQQEERKTNALMMREMALADYKERINERSADSQLGRQQTLATHNASLNAGLTAAEIAAREKSAIAVEDRRTAGQIAADERKERQDIAKEQRDLKTYGLKVSIETAAELKKARELANIEGQSDPVVGAPVEDAATGTYVLLRKSGAVVPTGAKFVPKAAGTEGMSARDRAAARSGAAPAPSGERAPANPELGRALAQTLNAYANATPQSHPLMFDERGKKKSREEIKRMVLERFGG